MKLFKVWLPRLNPKKGKPRYRQMRPGWAKRKNKEMRYGRAKGVAKNLAKRGAIVRDAAWRPKAKKQKKVEYPNKTHYTRNITKARWRDGWGNAVPAELDGNALAVSRKVERLAVELAKIMGDDPANGFEYFYMNSLYRSPAYNDHVGGASRSKHKKAQAVDTQPRKGPKGKPTMEQLELAGRRAGFLGFGRYWWGRHFDLGPAREW